MPAAPADLGLVERLPDRIEATLSELLSGSSDTVVLKLKGAFKEGLICTETRVIILKGGFMTGQMLGTNAFQQPYSNIAGVQVQWHLMSGYFELSAGGMQNTQKRYWSQNRDSDPSKAPNCISLNSKTQAEKFRQACSVILNKVDEVRRVVPLPSVVLPTVPTVPNDDVLSTLERLGKLRDAGVVTEEEFLAKKAELLKRL